MPPAPRRGPARLIATPINRRHSCNHYRRRPPPWPPSPSRPTTPTTRLVEEFDHAAATTRRIAPECVGLTLTFVQDGVSFTWVATDLDSAALDAIQYLEGGPGVAAVQQGSQRHALG